MDGMWSGRMVPVEVSTTHVPAGSAAGGSSMAVAPGVGALLGGRLRGWWALEADGRGVDDDDDAGDGASVSCTGCSSSAAGT